MKLPRDLLSGEYIAPDVFLCQTDKEIISKIQVLNLQGTFKWAKYSEISCTIPRIYMDETSMEETLHPAYDLVEGLRLIYLDGFGYFQIQEPILSTDGIREVKEITAFSSEYMLSQKYLETFVINKGVVDNAASIDGVQLYNQDDTEHSLLHLVLSEKAPEWTIGHVDPELATEQRSFEVDKQSIYDFLTNDVQDAFKCVVLFDTITNEINIYKEEDDEHYQTDVYMTFDNLSKSVNISYTTDDIKTMITVTGDEDLDIREVNFGLPYILDLSYYHTIEWMGQKLYDKFSAYQNKLENSREAFRTLSYNINEANEKLEDLQGRSSDTLTDGKMTLFLEFLTNFYHYIKDTKDAYMPDTTLLNELTEQFIGLYDIYTKTKDTELKAGKTYYTFDSVHQTYNVVQNPDVAYISTYYEKDPRSTAWRNAWNSFTATISNASVSKSSKDTAVLNILRTNTKSSNPTPTIFNLLGLEFLTPYQDYYKKAQSAMVTGGISKVNGWPTNENSAYHQYYALKKMLDAVEDEIKLRQSEIDAIQKTLNGLYATRTILSNDVSIYNPANFDADDLRRLSPFLREDEYSNDDYVTKDNDTYKDKIDTEEELLNDALTELHKLAQPQLRIDENIFNLLALPEFAPIQYQFELGNFVTTEIRPDYIKKSRLLEVTINFDNLSEISVVFGDLIDVKSQADVHADLLSQAISVGKQVASSAGHWTDGVNVATEMQNKLNQGLLDAATVLKSIDGTQNVEIDKYGIHLSTIDSSGDKSPKQGWIVNNQLAYTDDNWLSTKSVFGEFTYDNKTYWGVLADAVVAGYIEGSVIKGSEIIGGTGSFYGDVVLQKRLSFDTGYATLRFRTEPYRDTDGSLQNGYIGLVLENVFDDGYTETPYSIHQVAGNTMVGSGYYYHTAVNYLGNVMSQFKMNNEIQLLANNTIFTVYDGGIGVVHNNKSIFDVSNVNNILTITPSSLTSTAITKTLILPNTADTSSTAESNCALKIGDPTGTHLEFDTNEIIAKSTKNTPNTLTVNSSLSVRYHDGITAYTQVGQGGHGIYLVNMPSGSGDNMTVLSINPHSEVPDIPVFSTSGSWITFAKNIHANAGITSASSIILNNGIALRSYDTNDDLKTLIYLNNNNNVIVNGNTSGNTYINGGTIYLQGATSVSGTLSVSGRTTTAGVTTSGSIIPDTHANKNLGGVANGWQRIYIGHEAGENNGLYLAGSNKTDAYWLCGFNQHGHFIFGTTSSDYLMYYQSRLRNTSNTGQSFRITNGAAEDNSSGTVYDYDDPARVYIVGGADSTSTWVSIPPAYNRTVTSAANLYITNHGTLARSTSSSKRYKHDIRLADKYHADMMSVLDIDVVKFKYNDGYVKDGNYHGEDVVGFIAEQIEEVSPDCVTYEDGKVESWNERIMIPKMLYVIQQQQKQIEKLQDIVSALERR